MSDAVRDFPPRPMGTTSTGAPPSARFRSASPLPAPTSKSGVSRNSGPSFSYELMRHADHWIPRIVFAQVMRIGAWVAMLVMPRERRHSREYLTVVLGRPARWSEIYRHFYAYTEMFVLRSRLAEGEPHPCEALPSCEELLPILTARRPALFGTFHVGNSDLLGFLLGKFGGHIHMIRLRMDSSRDTHRLGDRFGHAVSFIWVNDTDNLLFSIKEAAESGRSIALKCDRPEHSSKLEPFEFLGQRRLFPFTIYHLAILFDLPVVFCLALPNGSGKSTLDGSPVFVPDSGSKSENLERGRKHFQAILREVETLLRANPYLWFNFTPLIPAAAPDSVSTGARIISRASCAEPSARV
jgi:predicted LPLAT superfamily acyltransferase